MQRYVLSFFILLAGYMPLSAQVTFPDNGVQDKRAYHYALTNATIQVDFQTRLDKATLIIKSGRIVAVGKNLPIPVDAQVIDMEGKWLYPSFIELYADYGLPEPESAPRGFGREQFLSDKDGPFAWNEALRPEIQARELFAPEAKKASEWRKFGFGAVLSHVRDGIVRGTGTLLSLHEGMAQEIVVKDIAAAHFSFNKGSSSQNYPSSLMGSIALLRQTYLDADWYAKGRNQQELNLSLEAFNRLKGLPAIIEAQNWMEVLRADRLGDEFGVQYIIRENGDAYQRLNEIKNTQAALIVPVNYPAAYEVGDPLDARLVSLAEMKHWELAPTNALRLAEAGIRFALTADGLKNKSDFLKNIRKAIALGLKPAEALKALTATPAQLLGAEAHLGSLQNGRLANFLVASGDIFESEAILFENWVQGHRYVLNPMPEAEVRGNYRLQIGTQTGELQIGGEYTQPDFKIILGSDTLKAEGQIERNLLTLRYIPKSSENKAAVRLSGWRQGQNWQGKAEQIDGTMLDWTATFTSNQTPPSPAPEKKPEIPTLGTVIFPFLAYGNAELPTPQTYLFKNATVWTNEVEGVLLETDVLVQNGKIIKVGKNLNAPGATVVDATGKHLTSGIIDEHSHIAISRGVNEGGQSITSEVRIGDVVNSEDINIYRQLAGGVTAAQLLHGSANAIGGQSALVKLRWGLSPEKMKIEGAEGFIKFALGENVTRKNSGNLFTERYPQTRMGVEQVFVDGFTRALAYQKARASGKPYRRDLELEALSEILEKKRFITCHSYIQSEINMLMKVAERFGFQVNTFTHILEGYKLADKMQKHGAGASSFADWWGYKYEVKDAIPYNPALMHENGVVTAINSDDAEMGRRLNQEAAKAVKYGGVSEEEAWKMVTLNPAKLLHLDQRMGSIKVGKDADLVLWTTNPLSIYAVVEKTLVDGIVYFDRQEDAKKREEIRQERNRLIQKMLAEKKGGGAFQMASFKPNRIYHCETEGDE
ncbi:MAG: amidohydrolase family protein [Microscillaceae bacterium]|nr:amidohydrolase family protein [Microscillaceae bacterium]